MLVDRGSLLRKVSDRQLMSESINFNSISNMIYGISSMIYGIGASIDISVRSVLSLGAASCEHGNRYDGKGLSFFKNSSGRNSNIFGYIIA